MFDRYIAITMLVIWGAIMAFCPTYLSSEIGNGYYKPDIFLVLGLIVFSPVVRVAGVMFSQRHAEREFVNNRLRFFYIYDGYHIKEECLFTQNSFLIKEGEKISSVDIPVFICLIVMIFISAAFKDKTYQIGIGLALIVGGISACYSYWCSEKYLGEVAVSDVPTSNLYRSFTSAFPSLSIGLLKDRFLNEFRGASNHSRECSMKLLKYSITPAAIIEFGTFSAFVITSAIYLTIGNGKVTEVVPLFFHLSIMTSMMFPLSSQIPTLLSYRRIVNERNSGVESRESRMLSNFDVHTTNLGFRVRFYDIDSPVFFKFGSAYVIEGGNGSGKSTFLRRFARKIQSQTSVCYLTSGAALRDPERSITKLSDGQRQSENLIIALEQKPELIILDEALSGVSMKDMELASMMLNEFISEGGLVISVSHGRRYLNSQEFDIKELTKYSALTSSDFSLSTN